VSTYLDLSNAPSDPIERLLWLSGMEEAMKRELQDALQVAYFEARLENRLDPALAVGLHSRKRALAYTRAENEKRGRVISRWPDVG
jgi:hypothetical protein